MRRRRSTFHRLAEAEAEEAAFMRRTTENEEKREKEGQITEAKFVEQL